MHDAHLPFSLFAALVHAMVHKDFYDFNVCSKWKGGSMSIGRQMAELSGKTIASAGVIYASDCSFVSIGFEFTDGKNYELLIKVEPSVIGVEYHSDADGDYTNHILHEADHSPNEPGPRSGRKVGA
jgi:hypothetical protein